MKFNELKEGKIYTDRDGVSAFKFIGIYNEHLAEFSEVDYDEEKGDFVDNGFISPITHLFNKFEVTDLIEP